MSENPARTTVRVGLSFQVDRAEPPETVPLHEALLALRAVEVEAASQERAELYAELLMEALERAGN